MSPAVHREAAPTTTTADTIDVMSTTSRPVVLGVERLVLVAWRVIDALAGVTVLVHEARAAAGAGTARGSFAADDRARDPALV